MTAVAIWLLLLAGGIALTQVVSDPRAVTLRWLRLGGLIAMPLLATAGAVLVRQGGTGEPGGPEGTLAAVGAAAVPFVVQLLAVQRDRRQAQRLAAGAAFISACLAAGYLAAAGGVGGRPVLFALAAAPLSAGLLGGFLMAMLLGHAYLTAGGEMTQQPFLRLVKLLALLLLARALSSGLLALWPYLQQEPAGSGRLWHAVMLTCRYLVGLAVPGVFTWMTWDCVRRRANQSATGILYVAGVLVIIGEGVALALYDGTGWPF